MMNSGLTSDRVYTALKQRLLAGEFRPGDRLDPNFLSDTLISSVTPVRDVLNILRGEGLVETRTGEGFFRPHLTAPDLEDLYDWSEETLHLAIRRWPPGVGTETRPAPDDPVNRIAELFRSIGERSANAEHLRAIDAVSDRLHAVRMVEDRVLGDVAAEASALGASYETGDTRDLARLVTAYHRRRRRTASEIVRAVYRTDTG